MPEIQTNETRWGARGARGHAWFRLRTGAAEFDDARGIGKGGGGGQGQSQSRSGRAQRALLHRNTLRTRGESASAVVWQQLELGFPGNPSTRHVRPRTALL